MCHVLELWEDILSRKRSERQSDERIDKMILQALNTLPFHSARTLSTTLKISTTTAWRHLKCIRLIVKDLKIIPHILTK
jgi:DNA-binding MurR/RpiR family transcriptional regulator